jgi:hypothetical protein
MVKQSHLALLLAPNQPYQIPAKAYDYMGTGTKILALAEEGATRDLIHSAAAGAVFFSSDTAGIKEFISRSMSQKGDPGRKATNSVDIDCEIRALTRRLAEHLDRLSGNS